MNILIAPNAFKHSLDGMAVAEAIAEGLKQSKLDCNCTLFPVGDGGDGTGSLIVQKFKGERNNVKVHDALGREINSSFGLIDNGRTAIIEMADAAGIRLLKKDELNPLVASSYGTGEMIRQALDKGARKIIIGMGGSATVDGGTGILSALGIRFLNAEGKTLTVPGELEQLESIDVSGLDQRVLDSEVIVLCDVNNRLLGKEGSAAVFGPQKGASTADVIKLDVMLGKLAAVALKQNGRTIATVEHGGTAGGAAAGLYGLINAKLVNGAAHFLEITGFQEALQIADLVFTGEGSIDEQTLQGKAPFAVADAAKKEHLPVIGLAGKVPLVPVKELEEYFDILLAIGNEPADLTDALKNTHHNLVRTARQIGNLLAAH